MKDIKIALRHLKKDPVLKGVIDQHGVLNYAPVPDFFDSLVGSIISQQLSLKAANTIYGRFTKLFPDGKYSHELILEISDLELRSCGMSWAKVRSVKDLSAKILDKSVRLDLLDQMTDEEVVTHLTQVKGIGRWTAEMKLMFTLQRPDIFPLQDIGIHNAFAKLYGLNRKHKSFLTKMQKISSAWKPYRTVACWYLWKSLDTKE
ncbi:MAG: DNA-3-methyladenine glycosylase [Patescibacteria group bacterium]